MYQLVLAGFANVCKIYVYVHVDGFRRVQFVISSRNAVMDLISSMWSTHLFNIATWESLYVLFPSCVHGRRMHIIHWPTPPRLVAISRHLTNGYVRGSWSEFLTNDEFKSERFVGDRFTERIRFESDVSEWVEVPSDIMVKFLVNVEGLVYLERDSRMRCLVK